MLMLILRCVPSSDFVDVKWVKKCVYLVQGGLQGKP